MATTRSRPNSLAGRIKWLFTKDGFPALISLVLGIIIGYFLNGIVGLIIGTLIGLAVLKLFKRLPLRFSPWQAVVIDWSPVLAKLCFSLAFLLPFADYMTLPDNIHNPNTLPKYLSIIFVIPKNLFLRPTPDVFPGFVFIVIIAVVLMYWGSLNLGKVKGLILALLGLLLYTMSPTITSTINGDARLRIIGAFFGVGYYFAWIALLLVLASKMLKRFLKVKRTPAKMAGMLNLVPPVIALGALSHFMHGPSEHSSLFAMFDFESDHHMWASFISGAVSGFSSSAIVDGADEGDDSGDTEDSSGSEDSAPPYQAPETYGPSISTNPDDPAGTTVQENPDGSKTKVRPDGTTSTLFPDGTGVATLPDGTKGVLTNDGAAIFTLPDGTKQTQYTDGTIYVEGTDGEKYVEYPDGTKKDWTPDGTLTVEKPNGDYEITTADGKTGGVKQNGDGSMDITSPFGGNLHCPKEGNPEGSLTTADGDVISLNGDGSGSITSSMGKMEIDKDGNMSGTLDDGNGNKVTMGKDGSEEIQTEEGDHIISNQDGVKANFHDGSFINADANGNITSAHVTTPEGTIDVNTDGQGVTHYKDDKGNWIDAKDGAATGAHVQDGQGTVDINTDDKGGMHLKDDKGNTVDVNKDGSGQTKDSDGNVAEQDKDGNASLTTKDGTKWVAPKNGSGFITDKKGNRIDMGQDGSLDVKDASGKVTHYTADDVGQMTAQAVKDNPGVVNPFDIFKGGKNNGK